MLARPLLLCLRALIFTFTLGPLFGQEIQPAPPSQSGSQVVQNQQTLQAFLQERRALAQQLAVLHAQGGTPQQISAWRQQNAGVIANQQQQAQALAATAALQQVPTNRRAIIPKNASATLRAFLTTQTALANAHAQIHNQLVQSLPSTASAAQISSMQQQEMQMFRQAHQADLQLQAQRAQTLASESAQPTLPTPRHLVIPSTATPQMAAYLTLRYQLGLEQIQLRNQYASASPSARQTAMQQWMKANTARLAQLQQLAQALVQTNSTNSAKMN